MWTNNKSRTARAAKTQATSSGSTAVWWQVAESPLQGFVLSWALKQHIGQGGNRSTIVVTFAPGWPEAKALRALEKWLMKECIPLGDALLSKAWVRSLTSSMTWVIHALFSFLSFLSCPGVKIIAVLPASQGVWISNKMMITKTLTEGLMKCKMAEVLSSLLNIKSSLETCAVGSWAAWTEQIFV